MKFLTAIFAISDEQAMWRVQVHDDAEAFALLVARWQEPIRRLCVRMLGDQHKAEDATQEAFARIYTKRKEFQQGARFSTFLWRVATNLCLDELRRVKRRKEFTSLANGGEGENEIWDDLAAGLDAPDQTAIAADEAERVRHALLQLPDHYRSVLVLRHYEDLKFREIAEVLAIPEGTVKSRMSEALDLLAVALKNSGGPAQARRKEALLI